MSGNDGREVTPVPIPNTEVKLSSADGSWDLVPVRVGRCQAILFRSSSAVELSAVNRSVVGSIPTCGAIGELSELAEGARLEIVYTSQAYQGFESLALRHRIYNIWPVGQVVKTPPFHGGNTGSKPGRVTTFGGLAQLGEHLPYKQGVGGSIPSSSTI